MYKMERSFVVFKMININGGNKIYHTIVETSVVGILQVILAFYGHVL